MNCSTCSVDGSFKDLWGCDEPTHEAVWEDGNNLFYNCPLTFISENIILFVNEMNYNRRYNINRPFNKQSARYIDAENELNKWLKHYTDEVRAMNK